MSALRAFASRKFILALGTVLVAGAQGEWGVVLATVAAYLGVEGAADYKQRSASRSTFDA